MRIVSVVGTRPQLIKAAALEPALRARFDARTAAEVRDPAVLAAVDPTLRPGGYLFATIHRAENREPAAIAAWAGLLGAVARPQRPVVLALHPGTRAALDAAAIRLSPDVRVIDPQGYRMTLGLQLHAAAALTDSGGVQRESAWLRVPCLILRGTTEWGEALAGSGGTMVVIGLDAGRAEAQLDRLAPAATPPADAGVEPQRLLIVLPSTDEFDSRTWRIASSSARRGHDVTVLARSRHGLPDDERHPDGYRIRRISAHAVDGLPWPLGRIARAFRRRAGTASPSGPPVGSGTEGPAQAGAPVAQVPAEERVWLPRRVARDVFRRWAILLTIRAYAKRAAPVAPPADLIHGMAYLGIPVALELAGRRTTRPWVVYDARDIYVDAAYLARMRGLARWAIARAERGWARPADRVITVNDPYADVMAERFGVERPLVVWNCAYRFVADRQERRFHARLALPAETPIVLYHREGSRAIGGSNSSSTRCRPCRVSRWC